MPRPSALSFELLETFVALIRAGGEATTVMRRLGLNQPALSKRLKHLQHAGPLLDRPWLVREGKSWRLTDEGRRVWDSVAELVDRYDNLQAFLGAEGAGTPRAVRFACGQQFAAGPVREAYRNFVAMHPNARVRVSTLRGRARIEGVSGGSLDLAIVSHDEPTIAEIARRPLHVESLASYGLCLACVDDSRWADAVRALPSSGVPAEALASFPLILPEPDSGIRRGFDETLQRLGLASRIEIALEVGGWPTLLAYVRDGAGVGVVSEGALTEAADLVIRPLDPVVFPPIEARLICRRRSDSGDGLDLTEPAAAWRDLIVEAVRSRPSTRRLS